ncbi:MAG: hypothetical protein IKZ52_02170 [Bacteroidales bacterium]|nr:hypothetical protein [Bacteroidales bacterium]
MVTTLVLPMKVTIGSVPHVHIGNMRHLTIRRHDPSHLSEMPAERVRLQPPYYA